MTLYPENSRALSILCEPYEFVADDKERADAVAQMIDVMVSNNGIGLAAPQVGIMTRLFVMQAGKEFIACFNPEIIASSSQQIRGYEGCLSFPDVFLMVSRPAQIDVKYQDINGTVISRSFDGVEARCFAHELDHLNGVCFTSKVGPLALKMARKRSKKK